MRSSRLLVLFIAAAACSSSAPGPSSSTTGGSKHDAAASSSGGTGGSRSEGGTGGTGGGQGGKAGDGEQGGSGGGTSGDAASSEADGGNDETPDAVVGGDDSATSTGDGAVATGDGGGTAMGPDIPGCTLKWAPSPMADGVNKPFEAIEMPDIQFPGGSPGTHQGVAHITVVPEHNAFRIDSHYMPPSAVDYDRVTQTGPKRDDRLRCETRGMIGPGGEVDLLNGQTWRLQWSLYIPSTLKGTGRFTHIMQMKYVDKGGGASGSPIFTVTLRPNDQMEVLFWIGGGSIATVDISKLHDKWISADLTMKIATAGSVHWTLKDGETVVVDKTQNGTTWPSDGARLRPKWGIYRGITDGVVTTYQMLSDMRAYQCQ